MWTWKNICLLTQLMRKQWLKNLCNPQGKYLLNTFSKPDESYFEGWKISQLSQLSN